MHIDVLITTTDIKNFLWLRDDDAAEPHIRDLAKAMAKSILDYGDADPVHEGQWHMPYVSEQDRAMIFGSDLCAYDSFDPRDGDMVFCVPVSVTRCARISYKPFHGESGDVPSEIARHDQLIAARPMHASPCEHQATPDVIVGQRQNKTTGQLEPIWEHPELHGNLTGWKQYRKMLPGERA